jgi:hypothetical protein
MQERLFDLRAVLTTAQNREEETAIGSALWRLNCQMNLKSKSLFSKPVVVVGCGGLSTDNTR